MDAGDLVARSLGCKNAALYSHSQQQCLEVVVTGSEDHGIIVWQPEIFINTTAEF